MRHQIRSVVALMALLLAAFVDARSQKRFADVTKSSGIEHQFVVYEGMFGGGACVIDVNNDGWEDLYLTGGTADDALYINNRDGSFRNIFEGSGLTDTRKYVTQGAACADINKDGWLDLFVTTITARDSVKKIPRAENLLFLNNGDGTFQNVTQIYGLSPLKSFSTGVSFGDFDLDGYTDAYVGNYFLSYEGTLAQINDATIVNATQTAEPYLLKNLAGKSFTNVFHDFGLRFKGFGFGGVFTDFDGDHDLDILVNHDFGYKATPNFMLENKFPEKQFSDRAKDLNLDLKINAMGTALADINEDGYMDYYVTNIRFNRLMMSKGSGLSFTDESKERGLDFVSISWGANFADFDNDMDLDLFVANGDLNPNDVPMNDYFFVNDQGRFKEQSAAVGVNDYGIGRGSVTFDMDNDGDLDILVVNQKPTLDYPVASNTHLFRNDSTVGNWIKVKLNGVESDRNGIGARVEVVALGKHMMREIDGGSSHLSQNSMLAHFGLGSASVVDSVIVTWPGGKRQFLLQQAANTLVVLNEIPGKIKTTSHAVAYLLSAFFVILAAGIFYRYLASKSRVRTSTVQP